jgi:hypothetical protein
LANAVASAGGAATQVFPRSYTSVKSALSAESDPNTVFMVKDPNVENGAGIEIVPRSELAELSQKKGEQQRHASIKPHLP